MTTQEYYEKLCEDSDKLDTLRRMISDGLIYTIKTIRDYYQMEDIEYVGLDRSEVEDMDRVIKILKEIKHG